MKLTKKQQQFIKDATTNSDVCSQWRTNIKETFPKLFKETELLVGKWYRSGGNLFNVMSITNETWCKCFGFDMDGWLFDSNRCINNSFNTTPATDKEVSEALIKEAKKRGFKEGVTGVRLDNYLYGDGNNKLKGDFGYSNGSLHMDTTNDYFFGIFKEGKWATIIETITKEQSEKELGKTIKG